MEVKENNAYRTTHENTHKGFEPRFEFRFEGKSRKNYSTIKQQKYSSGPPNPAAIICTGYEKTVFGNKLFSFPLPFEKNAFKAKHRA